MSHKATIWAIEQRGLEPTTKLLLWHLADRHNKDTKRCDPSQELLAHDVEMSRASVNRHLRKLESAGLIQRVRRIDPRTKKQQNTFYRLSFDSDFSVSQDDTRPVSQMKPKPCLNSGESRVSNCDTNPVKEPGSEPVCSANAAQHTHPAFVDFWKAYPRPRNRDKSRQLFSEALKARVDPVAIITGAKAYAAENSENIRKGRKEFLCFSDNWLKARRWEDHATAPTKPEADAAEIAEQVAKQIRDRKPWVISTVSAHKARQLVATGYVSEAECKAAGIVT
jgi:hypothetical protein